MTEWLKWTELNIVDTHSGIIHPCSFLGLRKWHHLVATSLSPRSSIICTTKQHFKDEVFLVDWAVTEGVIFFQEVRRLEGGTLMARLNWGSWKELIGSRDLQKVVGGCWHWRWNRGQMRSYVACVPSQDSSTVQGWVLWRKISWSYVALEWSGSPGVQWMMK